MGLAQRGLARALARLDAASGERDLTRVAAHVVGALGQQQVGSVVALAEEHQHGAASRVGVVGREEAGEVTDSDRPGTLLDRPQPLRPGRRPAQRHPEVVGDHALQLLDGLDLPGHHRRPAVVVDEGEHRQPHPARERPGSPEPGLGVGEQRVGHAGVATRVMAASTCGSS